MEPHLLNPVRRPRRPSVPGPGGPITTASGYVTIAATLTLIMRNLIIKHMAKHLPPRRILFMASLLYFSLLAGTRKSYAQGLIQFQENKGQWNAEVRYRAQLPGGYIYLRQAGFTYSLLDPEDVAAMRAAMHGDLPRDSTRGNYVIGPGHPSGARRASAPREPAQPGRIRAHAYRVDFLGASPGGEQDRAVTAAAHSASSP